MEGREPFSTATIVQSCTSAEAIDEAARAISLVLRFAEFNSSLATRLDDSYAELDRLQSAHAAMHAAFDALAAERDSLRTQLDKAIMMGGHSQEDLAAPPWASRSAPWSSSRSFSRSAPCRAAPPRSALRRGSAATTVSETATPTATPAALGGVGHGGGSDDDDDVDHHDAAMVLERGDDDPDDAAAAAAECGGGDSGDAAAAAAAAAARDEDDDKNDRSRRRCTNNAPPLSAAARTAARGGGRGGRGARPSWASLECNGSDFEEAFRAALADAEQKRRAVRAARSWRAPLSENHPSPRDDSGSGVDGGGGAPGPRQERRCNRNDDMTSI